MNLTASVMLKWPAAARRSQRRDDVQSPSDSDLGVLRAVTQLGTGFQYFLLDQMLWSCMGCFADACVVWDPGRHQVEHVRHLITRVVFGIFVSLLPPRLDVRASLGALYSLRNLYRICQLVLSTIVVRFSALPATRQLGLVPAHLRLSWRLKCLQAVLLLLVILPT